MMMVVRWCTRRKRDSHHWWRPPQWKALTLVCTIFAFYLPMPFRRPSRAIKLHFFLRSHGIRTVLLTYTRFSTTVSISIFDCLPVFFVFALLVCWWSCRCRRRRHDVAAIRNFTILMFLRWIFMRLYVYVSSLEYERVIALHLRFLSYILSSRWLLPPRHRRCRHCCSVVFFMDFLDWNKRSWN